MRGRAPAGTWARLAGALALCSPTAACLDDAGPGIGVQRFASRGVGDLELTPLAAGAPHLMLTRWSASGDEARRTLHALPVDGGPERLRVEHTVGDLIYPLDLAWDARGRAYFPRDIRESTTAHGGKYRSREIVRVDLGGAVAEPLGRHELFDLSSARGRLLLQPVAGLPRAADLDGRETVLERPLDGWTFVGDGLLYADSLGVAWLAADAATPARLGGPGTDAALLPARGDALPDLLLRTPLGAELGGEASVVRVSLAALDAAGVELTRARFGSNVVVSLDGERLAFAERTDDPATIVVRVLDPAGSRPELRAEVRLDTLPALGEQPEEGLGGELFVRSITDLAFRPGTGDLWFRAGTRLFVLHADGVLTSHTSPDFLRTTAIFRSRSDARAGLRFTFEGGGGSVFSADGRFFALERPSGGLALGACDAPDAGALVTLATPGTVAFVYDLDAGERLLMFRARDESHLDVYTVDLSGGAPTEPALLARDTLFSAAVSAERILLVEHATEGQWWTGDLVAIERATQERQLLGRNVSEFALAPCRGCDRLAAGRPIAYAVNTRFPSSLEGAWVGSLP